MTFKTFVVVLSSNSPSFSYFLFPQNLRVLKFAFTHFSYFLFIHSESHSFPFSFLFISSSLSFGLSSLTVLHPFLCKQNLNLKGHQRKYDPMGSVLPELSLDLRPSFVPKTITDFLRHLSSATDRLATLHDFLARLEDELRKIHAFKRELPLSMLLLNDG